CILCQPPVALLYSTISSVILFFFFFQAEDGIRDRNVTGVQTCALPICLKFSLDDMMAFSASVVTKITGTKHVGDGFSLVTSTTRSEERRVGKECRSRRGTED